MSLMVYWTGKIPFVSSCKSTLPKHREIYKGNSEKYKVKIRKQYIHAFGPKDNFVGSLRWLAAFLRS